MVLGSSGKPNTQYLAPLPVNVIWGVGPKLLERLNNAAIHTVRPCCTDRIRMKRWLGVIGPQIVHLARGEDQGRWSHVRGKVGIS